MAKDLNNLGGALCLVGISTKGVNATGQLTEARGRMEIAAVDMTLIDNTRGVLILRDSHVKTVSNHRGQIQLFNSKIDTLTNAGGDIQMDATSSVGP